jgi:hypothetical protein
VVVEDDAAEDEDDRGEEEVEGTDNVVAAPEEELGVSVIMLVSVFVTEDSAADAVVTIVPPGAALPVTVVVTCVEGAMEGAELVDEGPVEDTALEDEALVVDTAADEEEDVPSIVNIGLMFPESPNKQIM